MTATQVTEEAMLAASMSLFISDQGMLNAGISSVVYSNAVGATEGTLNLVNADTITDEKLRAEIKEQEEKNQDALEAASDMVIAEMERELERLSNPVKYANGQFTIGGITVDEEDMDATVDEMVNEFDAVVANHNLDAEQATTLFALLTAYQSTEDPEIKAQILQQIKEDVSPEVAVDMANNANERKDASPERNMTSQEAVVESVAQTTSEVEWNENTMALVNDANTVTSMANMRTDIDVGEANPFADMSGPSDEYNTVAQGDVQIAEVAVENDAAPLPTLNATL